MDMHGIIIGTKWIRLMLDEIARLEARSRLWMTRSPAHRYLRKGSHRSKMFQDADSPIQVHKMHYVPRPDRKLQNMITWLRRGHKFQDVPRRDRRIEDMIKDRPDVITMTIRIAPM